MRKRNIFGKRVSTSKPLYYLLIMFALAIMGYFIVDSIQSIQLLKLQEEQSRIQTSINNLLIMNQESGFQEVDELIPYLPQNYSEAAVFTELHFIKDLAGLSTIDEYDIDFTYGVSSPFSDNLGDDLNYVEIEISMTLDDYESIFDYIDSFEEVDRFYYFEEVIINMLDEDRASVSMVLYTFYMNQ